LSYLGSDLKRETRLLILVAGCLLLATAMADVSKHTAVFETVTLRPVALQQSSASKDGGKGFGVSKPSPSSRSSKPDQPSPDGIPRLANIPVGTDTLGLVAGIVLTDTTNWIGLDRFRRGPPKNLSF
jgi:hypothetical protein